MTDNENLAKVTDLMLNFGNTAVQRTTSKPKIITTFKQRNAHGFT